MKRRATLDQIQDTLTTTKWIGKILAWPESTLASPSGFHLTDSKALVAKHDLSSDSPEYATLEEQREQLIQWQVDLLNTAIKNQYLVAINRKCHDLKTTRQPQNTPSLSHPPI